MEEVTTTNQIEAKVKNKKSPLKKTATYFVILAASLGAGFIAKEGKANISQLLNPKTIATAAPAKTATTSNSPNKAQKSKIQATDQLIINQDQAKLNANSQTIALIKANQAKTSAQLATTTNQLTTANNNLAADQASINSYNAALKQSQLQDNSLSHQVIVNKEHRLSQILALSGYSPHLVVLPGNQTGIPLEYSKNNWYAEAGGSIGHCSLFLIENQFSNSHVGLAGVSPGGQLNALNPYNQHQLINFVLFAYNSNAPIGLQPCP